MATDLLSIGNDPKTAKGIKYNVSTAIQYLRPHTQSGVANLCAHASNGCAIACLNTSGHGHMEPVQKARQRRTELFMKNRSTYWAQLIPEIEKHSKKCKKLGMLPAVRLNGTSDILWEHTPVTIDGVKIAANIMELFPDVQYYDYTKYPYAKRPTESLPRNYDLTFSRSESNEPDVLENLLNGRRVAVVYFTKPGSVLPNRYTTIDGSHWEVIDGDDSDVRFNDPASVIIHLSDKGLAKKDRTGFVLDPEVHE